MRRRRREAAASDSNSPKVYRREDQLGTAHIKQVISPTHERTEGRALVWGLEFTTKVAHYGGIQRNSLLGYKEVCAI
jgi:hypothetical protein